MASSRRQRNALDPVIGHTGIHRNTRGEMIADRRETSRAYGFPAGSSTEPGQIGVNNGPGIYRGKRPITQARTAPTTQDPTRPVTIAPAAKPPVPQKPAPTTVPKGMVAQPVKREIAGPVRPGVDAPLGTEPGIALRPRKGLIDGMPAQSAIAQAQQAADKATASASPTPQQAGRASALDAIQTKGLDQAIKDNLARPRTPTASDTFAAKQDSRDRRQQIATRQTPSNPTQGFKPQPAPTTPSVGSMIAQPTLPQAQIGSASIGSGMGKVASAFTPAKVPTNAPVQIPGTTPPALQPIAKPYTPTAPKFGNVGFPAAPSATKQAQEQARAGKPPVSDPIADIKSAATAVAGGVKQAASNFGAYAADANAKAAAEREASVAKRKATRGF